MLNIQERNRKITNLIESVIRDHCRIYDTTLETTDDGIIVHYNDEPLYYLGLEFNKNEFNILFNGFVFSNLQLSKTIKLREIYKDDDITKFLTESELELLFYEDEHLMTNRVTPKGYNDYSILKTAFAIELYEQVNNTVTIRNHLTGLLKEREGVRIN